MRPCLYAGALFVSLLAAGCSGNPSVSNLTPATVSQSSSSGSSKVEIHPLSARAMPIGQSVSLCPAAAPGTGGAVCHAMQRTDITPNASLSVPPSTLVGLQPSDLRTAYGLSSAVSGGQGQTVAVVVAYDNAALASDLAIYRQEFSLPACTTQSGCLSFVYGKKAKPSKDPAWSAESDLDAEMVSAICPNCKIMVAEASSNKLSDLAATVSTAVSAGATVVSNSYSIPEDPSDLQYDSVYNAPGVPMTAGAGDTGYGIANYPASSGHVTAVGGTTLSMNGGSVLSESVWNSTGSGCSTLFAKPAWQTDTGCTMRTLNDVAVVGDPNTGVATYIAALGGWNVFGGTSVGSPIVASMYALAGNGNSTSGASILYSNSSLFRSIAGTSGTCALTYLCTASTGYNGPAGLGTPYGVVAF